MASRLVSRRVWPLTLVVATVVAAAVAAGPAATAQPSVTHGWRIIKTIKGGGLSFADVAKFGS